MTLRIIRNIEPYEYHCFPCLSQEVTYADLASIVSKKDSMEFLQEKLYKIIFNQHLNKMTWSVCVSAWCHGKEKPDILYGLPPNRTSYQRRSSTRSIFRYWRRRTRRRTISSRHARHILEIFINGLFFLFFNWNSMIFILFVTYPDLVLILLSSRCYVTNSRGLRVSTNSTGIKIGQLYLS